MSVGKGRILSIIFGTVVYLAFFCHGILNYPMSWVVKVFFKAPILGLAIAVIICLIFPDRKTKSIPNDQVISGVLFLANILLPILLGLLALWYVVYGDYTEIDWLIWTLAFCIGLNGVELIRGKIGL
ncbi:hypothetical protein [Desulfosporosinus meridiei]|uniref:Uncharacterized protein n=1 Tax=Desulfosporosinus meridiei (strain ATCC BAA-275 / DSM 13257 / KCTC 12902 / NCIMB 13706 / S10) TaxID=768704 RepID=J7ISR8_DESMD|nr:hypothetical protein [Desulfosporosinus meridiei]AFQ44720.1 hypothetical protein Desmer_2813 [Desulfosporosinus meridiei DSM 13257]